VDFELGQKNTFIKNIGQQGKQIHPCYSTNRNHLTQIQGNMDLFLFLLIFKSFLNFSFTIDLHQMSVFFLTYTL
jgi:hypothetical protein